MYKVEVVNGTPDVMENKIMQARLYDTGSFNKIDDEIRNSSAHSFAIVVKSWAILHVNNDQAERSEYDRIALFDESGEIYSTGSIGAMESFTNLWNMLDEQATQVQFVFYKKKSRKREGEYMSCTVKPLDWVSSEGIM